MTVISTLHNHCTMCDGADTLDAMAQAAIDAGFTDLGISCHCVTDFDIEYSLKDEAEYIRRVGEAKDRYAGKLNIALGVEQDYYAPVKNPDAFDYMIGSVHYIRDENSGVYYSVDNTPQMLRECIDNMFGGDAMEMVRRYYDLVVKNVKTFQPDIVGHFDLVTKFNENGEFFDEESDEYKAIATHALEQCADNGCVFEVNTGAMSRNWRSRPYPQPFLLRHMCSMGVPVMLSADSHSASTLTYAFDQALDLIKSSLYSQILQWRNGKFEKVDI